ncbi:MAG: GatB/YqeY domain-containing protein [Patescibacteria group bacterium]
MEALLEEKIRSDLEGSMRQKDQLRTDTLRMLLSSIHSRLIEKKGQGKTELSNEEVLEVVAKEAKKRREAAEIFISGGRNDLAEKERKELVIVEIYLPAQASDEEIEKVVKKAIEIVNPTSQKDFGKVMAEAMKDLKGKADGTRIGNCIKQFLSF